MAEQTEKTEQPAETPVAKLKYNPERERWVDLDYPVIFGDEEITRVRVKRCTGKEVQDFMDGMGQSTAFVIPPVIDCPVQVWDALDADDQDKIGTAANDFFPRRLRTVAELILGSGAATSDSSPSPSAGQDEKS